MGKIKRRHFAIGGVRRREDLKEEKENDIRKG